MSIFALAWAKLRKQLGFSVYTLYDVHVYTDIQCTHCTNCTMYTMYPPTAGNQSSCIVYTQYSWTALPHGSSPPSGLGLSHRRAQRRTIYRKPCNAVERALRPSVPSIPLLREFPCLVWHREGTLSRVWPRFQARAAWKLGTDWLAGLTYITI